MGVRERFTVVCVLPSDYKDIISLFLNNDINSYEQIIRNDALTYKIISIHV